MSQKIKSKASPNYNPDKDPDALTRKAELENPLNNLSVEEIVKNLGDRWWRLNNLYYIKDENGKKVLFRPELREAQRTLHENFWYFTIVPKARQLGVTTYFAILYFDAVLFSQNKTAGIIAHRQEDMKKIFRNKIKFAWDNLHPWLRKYIGEPINDSANELVWPSVEQGGNGGAIFVSMSTRGDTVQYLHISEFGYICAKSPEKAEEIVSGAINSVHLGNVVSIESTAEGQEGYFYEFCMEAERMRKEGKELTPMDWKIFFFPWWIDPKYQLQGNVALSKEDQEYFTTLEKKHGVKLTQEQKSWYVKKKATLKDKMFSQFPSTLDEAFRKSIEGAYYKREMQRVYLENRICPIVYDPMCEVETWWDLGMNDFNVILLTQTVNGRINFIDMYWNHGYPLSHYYDWLKQRKDEMGYRYGRHHMPHDIEVEELGTGISRKQTLYNLGMRNITVGTKVAIQDGIDRVRHLFSRFWFDEEKCKRLHEALFNYRREWDEKMAAFKDKPRHDENSHFADPVRLLGELWRDVSPLLEGGSEESYDQAFFG